MVLSKFFDLPQAIKATLLKDVKEISWSADLFLLALVQLAIFAPSIFLMNDVGMSFIGAIGPDHGSMLASMVTILEPHTLYDQMAGYHSSYYGWTYFFFSFWFLLPFKIIGWMAGVPSFLLVFIGLKILHVLYGLLATFSLYFLATRFLKRPVAFIAALVFGMGSILFRLNFMFHPENIGLFFSNLAMIYLWDFAHDAEASNGKRTEYYFIILLFLVLSTLAKPTFFLLTFPLYLVLFAVYQNRNGLSLKDFSGATCKLVRASAVFSVALFFLINPWFFLRLNLAIQRQVENIAFQEHSPLALKTASDSFMAWIHMLNNYQFVEFSIFSTAVLMIVVGGIKKDDVFNRKLTACFLASVLAGIVFTMNSMRTFVVVEYLIPFSAVLTLSALIVIQAILKPAKMNFYMSAFMTLVIVGGLSLSQIQANWVNITSFYDYRSSIQYKIYRYIETSVASGSSIAHDQIVAVPDDKEIKNYHYWQHSAEEIENAHPDYLMFDRLNTYNGHLQDPTLFLLHMIATEPYTQVHVFNVGGYSVEVWQRK